MGFKLRSLAAFLAGALAILAGTTSAFAHDHREVGPDEFTVGWKPEPAFEGLLNGVSLRVAEHLSEMPVEGVEQTLNVEVTHVPTNTAKTYNFKTMFRTPGSYVVNMIPTASGVDRFRMFGKVGATNVNETFESRGAGGKFDDIEVSTAIQFPVSVAGMREMEGSARGSAATAQQAQGKATDAGMIAASARTLAIAGIVLAAIGAVVGGVSMLRGRAGH